MGELRRPAVRESQYVARELWLAKDTVGLDREFERWIDPDRKNLVSRRRSEDAARVDDDTMGAPRVLDRAPQLGSERPEGQEGAPVRGDRAHEVLDCSEGAGVAGRRAPRSVAPFSSL